MQLRRVGRRLMAGLVYQDRPDRPRPRSVHRWATGLIRLDVVSDVPSCWITVHRRTYLLALAAVSIAVVLHSPSAIASNRLSLSVAIGRA